MKKLHITNIAKTLLVALAATASLTSCETIFYEEEQYRKEIYIVSGDNNIVGQEYTFGEESVGYLSIYAGGTTPIEENVDIELEVYSDYLRNYNKRIHGDNYNNYEQELNPDYYQVESWIATLDASSGNPYVRFPIKVDVDNIDLEQEYYIPIRIKSVSKYMISESRQNVLYRIFVKNDYATTKSTTYYTMNGTEQAYTEANGEFTPKSVATAVNSTKSVIPTAQHSIRLLPSTSYDSSSAFIHNQSIIVTVHPEDIIDVPVYVEGEPTGEFVQRQKVTIKPWQESSTSILVGDIDGEQSYYDPETQTFTLNYRYAQKGKTDWNFMKEVLTPLNITNN